MCFLRGKVLLTKDNLVKRKWKGCTKCCFCDSKETVQYLFISCTFVRIIWRMISFTYNLPHQLILLLCLVIGKMGSPRLIRLEYALVFRLYVGLYGLVAIIRSLTSKRILTFYRLFVWLHIRFICGPTSSRWVSRSL
jgi:hypothetical protein